MTAVSRRQILLSFPALAMSPRSLWAKPPAPQRVLLGTGGGGSKGIYTAGWNANTGELGEITLAAEVESPTFLAVHAHGQEHFVYAVSEVPGAGARLTAYTTVAGQVALRKLNDVASDGDGPTHVAVSRDGRAVFCANYVGGSVSSFHVQVDGSLSDCVSHLQFTGSGPYPGRQEAPHTHSVNPSPDGKWLLVNDLGVDRIFIFRVDTRTARLTPAEPPFWAARPGSGPRHVAFHPNGHWLYSVNELTSTVDLLEWDSHAGTLTLKGSVSTLKEGFPPNTAFAGEIVCSADGHFVYVGNRVAEDSIAVFHVDPHTGRLTLVQLAPNPGRNPRHIALDPTGRWLVLCDVGSSTIAVLARDRKFGKLSDTGHRYTLAAVEFVSFI